jgi:hypothetical protein
MFCGRGQFNISVFKDLPAFYIKIFDSYARFDHSLVLKGLLHIPVYVTNFALFQDHHLHSWQAAQLSLPILCSSFASVINGYCMFSLY